MSTVSAPTLETAAPRGLLASRHAPELVLLAVFVASRAAYAALGVRFEMLPVHRYAQLLSPELLRHELIDSLWHLHAQPPLFNLLVGLAYQLPPGHEALALETGFGALGLALGLATLSLMRRLGVPSGVALGLTALAVASPSVVLYEHWLYYAYVVTTALTLGTLALHRFLSGGRRRDAWAFFGLLAAVALTWSLFHLAWLVGVAGVLAVALRADPLKQRRALVAALPAVLLVGGLYAKNGLMVGSWSASSWSGLNLARVTVRNLPPDERDRMVANGELSRFAAVRWGRDLHRYVTAAPWAPTGVAVLDRADLEPGHPNWNATPYLAVSRALTHDATTVLRRHPGAYAKGVVQAFSYWARPAHDFNLLGANRERVAPVAAAFDVAFQACFRPLVSGHVADRADTVLRLSFAIVFGVPLLLVVAIRRARAAWREGSAASRAFALTLAFIVGNVVFVTLVGNMVEVGENQRFRFSVDLLLVVLAGVAWTPLARRLGRSTAP